MDETELERPKKNRYALSVAFPSDLNNKIDYIKKRTFLSKRRIILMLCAKGIEAWFKSLRDEEVALRTAAAPKAKVPVNKVSPAQPKVRSPEPKVAPTPLYPHLPPAPNLYVPTAPYTAPVPSAPATKQPPTIGWPLPPAPTATNKTGYGGDVNYDPWTVPLDKEEK